MPFAKSLSKMQRSTQRGHGAGSTKEKYPLNINQKKLDFELIKNTYKDVVDIITFDELVQRFDRIISFL